jgi:pyruvate dehydrogenase E2 component (dihydrolipoamide acetyltransferase)
MEEARLESWLVPPGVSFAIGEVLYEVETEKVTTGVEATVAGSIVRALVADGDQLEVGALLAVIADPGERPTPDQIDAFVAGREFAEPPAASNLSSDDQQERVSALPAEATASANELAQPSRAMPKTRALAKSIGVDLAEVRPLVPGAVITEQQVRAAALARAGSEIVSAPTRQPVAERPNLEALAPAPSTPEGIEVRERRRLSGIQRRMADVTARTWTTVPHFSQSVDIDASGWQRRRDMLRDMTGMKVGYTDLILTAMVRAVQEVPDVNSSYLGDELVIYRDVNISIAVDSPHGLQVPVLHRMQDLSEAGRARLLRDRTAKARDGSLGLDDVKGGTITMSNLGRFGIEGGMPMLTTPQAAIVFVGAIVPRVVPVAEGIGVRPICTLVTAFDHRALDGATAARFTSALRRLLQEETR